MRSPWVTSYQREDPFDHRLGLGVHALGVDRRPSSVTGTDAGVPLTEHDDENTNCSTPAAMRRLDEVDGAVDVVVEVLGGLAHRLADVLVRGEVDDRVDARGRGTTARPAPRRRCRRRRARRRHRVGAPSSSVSSTTTSSPVVPQRAHGVRSDVAGAAGDECGHRRSVLLVGMFNRLLLGQTSRKFGQSTKSRWRNAVAVPVWGLRSAGWRPRTEPRRRTDQACR